ncbi:MAG TPA: hypothetical protein VMR49_00095 [Candidatus Paceibacterota bacterium]|jgi:hypothetical protein|nr:hypothetical protein [Candidatus Paceibacterota bacterium]
MGNNTILLDGTRGKELNRIEEFLKKEKVHFVTIYHDDNDSPTLMLPNDSFSYKGELDIINNIDIIKSCSVTVI